MEKKKSCFQPTTMISNQLYTWRPLKIWSHKKVYVLLLIYYAFKNLIKLTALITFAPV